MVLSRDQFRSLRLLLDDAELEALPDSDVAKEGYSSIVWQSFAWTWDPKYENRKFESLFEAETWELEHFNGERHILSEV